MVAESRIITLLFVVNVGDMNRGLVVICNYSARQYSINRDAYVGYKGY